MNSVKNSIKSNYLEEAKRVLSEEIKELRDLISKNQTAFISAVECILKCRGKVIVTGLGKSGLVGRKVAATFASTGTPSTFLNAAEALHGDLGAVQRQDVVLMVSNSAQTEELLHMLPSLKGIGAAVIGMFGRRDTQLARRVNVILDIGVSKEACPLNLAPMSSTTNTIVLGDCLAASVMKARNFTRGDFAVFHPKGTLGRKLLLKASDVMHSGQRLPWLVAENTMREVVVELTRTNSGAVPITEDSKVVGIITDGDVRRFVLSGHDLSTVASQIMTREPVTVEEDWPLVRVLEVMERPERQITVVPVNNRSGKYVGIIRIHDIL